jgi:hypothetical protein
MTYAAAQSENLAQGRERPWTTVQRDYYDTGYRIGTADHRENRPRDHARYRNREFTPQFEAYFREGYYDGYDGLAKKYRFADEDSLRLEPTGERRNMKCESFGRRVECPAPVLGRVSIVRLTGGGPCAENQTWGWTPQGIWVDRNCRAEFQFELGRPGRRAGMLGPRMKMKCESSGGRLDCPASVGGGVMMLRQMGEVHCIANENWGWTASGIWTDRGCRGEFEFYTRGAEPPPPPPRRDPRRETGGELKPAEQWAAAERSAYETGYQRGRDDYRNNLTNEYRRYFNEYNRSTEPYYRRGYEDGFAGRPKTYSP